MNKYTTFLAIFVLLFSVSFAIELIQPIKAQLKGAETIDLGKIGPGQTIFVSIEPKVITGGKFDKGGQYDQAVVTALPPNWKAKNSKIYGNPLQVEITADENAKEGVYSAEITTIDQNYGEQLNNVSFKVRVQITKDVLETSITPTEITVGPDQPARYVITITNKGSAADVFEVSSEGIKRWEYKKPVYVAAQSTKTVFYEITNREEESYKVTLKVKSKASSLIQKDTNITLNVRTDILADYKATNNGVLIFPFFENIVYSFAGLLSNLF
ncbi:MAG: hypothetical protein AABX38_06025 [Candidatus Micrarchaeota archaeon]